MCRLFDAGPLSFLDPPETGQANKLASMECFDDHLVTSVLSTIFDVLLLSL